MDGDVLYPAPMPSVFSPLLQAALRSSAIEKVGADIYEYDESSLSLSKEPCLPFPSLSIVSPTFFCSSFPYKPFAPSINSVIPPSSNPLLEIKQKIEDLFLNGHLSRSHSRPHTDSSNTDRTGDSLYPQDSVFCSSNGHISNTHDYPPSNCYLSHCSTSTHLSTHLSHCSTSTHLSNEEDLHSQNYWVRNPKTEKTYEANTDIRHDDGGRKQTFQGGFQKSSEATKKRGIETDYNSKEYILNCHLSNQAFSSQTIQNNCAVISPSHLNSHTCCEGSVRQMNPNSQSDYLNNCQNSYPNDAQNNYQADYPNICANSYQEYNSQNNYQHSDSHDYCSEHYANNSMDNYRNDCHNHSQTACGNNFQNIDQTNYQNDSQMNHQNQCQTNVYQEAYQDNSENGYPSAYLNQCNYETDHCANEGPSDGQNAYEESENPNPFNVEYQNNGRHEWDAKSEDKYVDAEQPSREDCFGGKYDNLCENGRLCSENGWDDETKPSHCSDMKQAKVCGSEEDVCTLANPIERTDCRQIESQSGPVYCDEFFSAKINAGKGVCTAENSGQETFSRCSTKETCSVPYSDGDSEVQDLLSERNREPGDPTASTLGHYLLFWREASDSENGHRLEYMDVTQNINQEMSQRMPQTAAHKIALEIADEISQGITANTAEYSTPKKSCELRSHEIVQKISQVTAEKVPFFVGPFSREEISNLQGFLRKGLNIGGAKCGALYGEVCVCTPNQSLKTNKSRSNDSENIENNNKNSDKNIFMFRNPLSPLLSPSTPDTQPRFSIPKRLESTPDDPVCPRKLSKKYIYSSKGMPGNPETVCENLNDIYDKRNNMRLSESGDIKKVYNFMSVERNSEVLDISRGNIFKNISVNRNPYVWEKVFQEVKNSVKNPKGEFLWEGNISNEETYSYSTGVGISKPTIYNQGNLARKCTSVEISHYAVPFLGKCALEAPSWYPSQIDSSEETNLSNAVYLNDEIGSNKSNIFDNHFYRNDKKTGRDEFSSKFYIFNHVLKKRRTNQ